MLSATSELDLAKVQAPIFSYFNGRVIKCPASLLTQLQRERSISADKGQAISNALLDQAEQIKRSVTYAFFDQIKHKAYPSNG